MKKFDTLKTIQLILFVLLTAACVAIVFLNKDLFHMIAAEPNVRLMCIMLWLSLGLIFLFTFLDFSLFASFKHDYRELDYAVHSDPVAGIANRYSSDVLIEKYLDKPLPQNMGAIMIELSNIKEINDLYGHVQGNKLIRDFSNILKLTSVDLCFVARNGGNKFLALFEEATEEKIEVFLTRIDQKVQANNSSAGSYPIQYKYGIAFHEGAAAKTVTELIALSNRRIYE
ncbi:MAG: GGDEF domain-containing protein [Clostridia bacterium]|nr:GGDEF domain-containing protein [Clostridia bacterium]